MTKNQYPLDVLHEYMYKVRDEINLFNKISIAKNNDDLK